MEEEQVRKLAHIEKIVAIRPIEGADNIEVAQVLGWECIVLKSDNFKVGDFVVYVEVDSVLPEIPQFEWLRPRKFRIKTIKLRKQISQGLVLPLSVLPPEYYELGDDVTDNLRIKHYDPEAASNQKDTVYVPQNKFLKFLLKFWICRKIILPFLRKPKGSWPKWVVKTDEPRIQNMPSVLERYKDKRFYVTEKIDYQSATFTARKVKKGLFLKKIFGVCSRNQWLKTETDSLYWRVARKYNLEKILLSHDDELTIQGEQGDPSVQKNKYGIKEPRLWVFNVINNRTGYHFSIDEIESFCKTHELEMVPVLDRNFELPSTVDEMVKYSTGKSVLNPKVDREGVVVRLIEDGKKIVSFKCISPTFLLKNDE